MSVLTKIFVVLLVVVSLLMASGLMVFVNRIEDFNKKVADAKAAEATQRAARLAAEQEVASAAGERDLAIANAREAVQRLQQEILAADDAARKAAASVASVNEENTRLKAQVEVANRAAQSSFDTIGEQQKVINTTANQVRDRDKSVAELQTQVAGNIHEIESLRAANRRQKEEIAALNMKLNEAATARTTAQAGTGREGQPGVGAAAAAMPAEGAFLNLRGVVKGRKNINGIEYATISIGASQKVQKGMRFNVTDGSNFLGYLTVDLVETDESVGHLEGPSLKEVHPGTQVRTQW